jgi:hypothetical protein
MSYSPLYNQNTIWIAQYNDGTFLREWDENGNVHPFNEIDKSRLDKFHFYTEDNVYTFDCKTGIFMVDGREFVFPLAGMPLDFAEGLIQYKDASTEFIAPHLKTSAYDGFEIHSYNMGWKVTSGNIKSQVVLSLPNREFNVQITILDKDVTLNWKVKL